MVINEAPESARIGKGEIGALKLWRDRIAEEGRLFGFVASEETQRANGIKNRRLDDGENVLVAIEIEGRPVPVCLRWNKAESCFIEPITGQGIRLLLDSYILIGGGL